MHVRLLRIKFGYPGSKPPWGSLTAINLNNGKIIWKIPFGEYDELTEKDIPLLVLIIMEVLQQQLVGLFLQLELWITK